MSFIGKRVGFKLVDGSSMAGIVAEVHVNPSDERNVWYELDTGWTVNERHVMAAYWYPKEEK